MKLSIGKENDTRWSNVSAMHNVESTCCNSYSQIGIYHEPEHQTRESGTDMQTDSRDDPMDVIEAQHHCCHKAAHELELEKVTINNDTNIDPWLLSHDKSVTAGHPNSPQGNQNPPCSNITTEDASAHPPSSPLSDLNMNRKDTGPALSPELDNGSNGQQKCPASKSEGSHKASKKQKANSDCRVTCSNKK